MKWYVATLAQCWVIDATRAETACRLAGVLFGAKDVRVVRPATTDEISLHGDGVNDVADPSNVRPATPDELAEINKALGFDPPDNAGPSSPYACVFPNYQSDTTVSGPVYVVVWPVEPGVVSVLLRQKDGTLTVVHDSGLENGYRR